ncbi:MAG: hypothetical protein K0S53_1433 [Bacteroidetes bacterium]|jgi:hypothetical protein|nr:hypothetical protein [Bacteroidota bacterium]
MTAQKKIKLVFSFLILMFFCFGSTGIIAQNDSGEVKMQDCCMMKDGKMMHIKSGKMEMLEREMIMKNGTKCMANGECVTLEGEKMLMKEGECMDMQGRITDCSSLRKPDSNEKSKTTIMYTCPKHPEIEDDQQGICPKCGTTLIEKK